MAAALAAHELGLSVLIVEKSSYVGGSTARSGGALWLPASPVLRGGRRRRHRGARRHLPGRGGRGIGAPAAIGRISGAPVRDGRHAAPHDAAAAVLGPRLLRLPPGGARAAARPGAPASATRSTPRFSANTASRLRARRHGGRAFAIPTTGADYRWMNLVTRVPRKGIPTFGKRIAQGVGGLLVGRRYAAGGQGLMAGLFAGVLRAGIPVWTDTDAAAPRTRRRRPRHRRGRGPRRPRGDDHRPARRGAGHRRLRPQHGHAVEIPVRVAGRQPEPGRRHQHRRRDPRRAGTGRRHRSDGSGVVVPRRSRRCPARRRR